MLDLVPGCCAAQDEPLEMMTVETKQTTISDFFKPV